MDILYSTIKLWPKNFIYKYLDNNNDIVEKEPKTINFWCIFYETADKAIIVLIII